MLCTVTYYSLGKHMVRKHGISIFLVFFFYFFTFELTKDMLLYYNVVYYIGQETLSKVV